MIHWLTFFAFLLSATFAGLYFWLRTKYQKLEITLAEVSVRLEEEKKQGHEKVRILSQAQETMKDSFKALSSDALSRQQSTFFDVAKVTFEKYSSDILKPFRESLEKVDHKIQDLERTRLSAYSSLTEQLKAVSTTQNLLHAETNKLVKALRAPNVRGQWGEMQLKRVVELAGMVEYCDFVEQQTITSEQGRIRPDLIVRLPNDRVIVIDAKTPLQAYLEAIELTVEEQRSLKLKEHAKQVKKHLTELSEKSYWERFAKAPEFVVLFLPGESFFSAALEYEPQLIEYGVDKKVLLATPTTLIALLRAVAIGWREEMVQEHAASICELGKSLHERLLTMTEHFIRLKKSIDATVDAYNKVVSSFESRVLTCARRFQDVGVAHSSEIAPLEPVEKLTKLVETQIYTS